MSTYQRKNVPSSASKYKEGQRVLYKGSPARVLEVNSEHRSYTVKRTNAEGTEFIGNEVNTPFEPNKRLKPFVGPSSSSSSSPLVVSLILVGGLVTAGALYVWWFGVGVGGRI